MSCEGCYEYESHERFLVELRAGGEVGNGVCWLAGGRHGGSPPRVIYGQCKSWSMLHTVESTSRTRDACCH